MFFFLRSEFPLCSLTPVFSLWFSFNRYDSPRSMSRTTLITNSFTFFPSDTISIFFYTCSPPPPAVHQFQIFELCRVSVYRCVLGLFSSREIWRGRLQKTHLLLGSVAVAPGAGHWVVPGWSLETPSLQPRPSKYHSLEGNNQVPWRQQLLLRRRNCLVSCKINTLLYIFREHKSAAIGRKIFILDAFPIQITPKTHFEYPGRIFGSVKYTF